MRDALRLIRPQLQRSNEMSKSRARLQMLRLDAKMKRIGARGWRKPPKPAGRLKSVTLRTAMKIWGM